MNELNNLYNEYERTRPFAPLFTATKYGFEWSEKDGCLFYPENYLSSSRSELLARINPDLPMRICIDGAEISAAAKELPNAILVLCGERDWAEKAICEIAPFTPGDMLSRCITHRQLGDFLPYGDRSTRWFDVMRKSALPAAPKTRQKVEKAYALFKEDLSRSLFLAILRRYLLSSDALIPSIQMSEQYFTPLYRHLANETFIDCGGFIGDTLAEYLKIKNNAPFKEYIVFEPDETNHKKLSDFVATLSPELQKKISVHKLGVSRENETFKFSGGEGSNSYIGDDGEIEVNCVAMDDFLSDKEPTFIKMDLQGHEAFALLGGKEIISRHKPVLAISVYHFVQDLWELPLLMKSFYTEYEFFLRAYRPEEEYICYAVPQERIKN